jgi:hypothetical protein
VKSDRIKSHSSSATLRTKSLRVTDLPNRALLLDRLAQALTALAETREDAP